MWTTAPACLTRLRASERRQAPCPGPQHRWTTEHPEGHRAVGLLAAQPTSPQHASMRSTRSSDPGPERHARAQAPPRCLADLQLPQLLLRLLPPRLRVVGSPHLLRQKQRRCSRRNESSLKHSHSSEGKVHALPRKASPEVGSPPHPGQGPPRPRPPPPPCVGLQAFSRKPLQRAKPGRRPRQELAGMRPIGCCGKGPRLAPHASNNQHVPNRLPNARSPRPRAGRARVGCCQADLARRSSRADAQQQQLKTPAGPAVRPCLPNPLVPRVGPRMHRGPGLPLAAEPLWMKCSGPVFFGMV